jgi:IS605 OrfB family transposase
MKTAKAVKCKLQVNTEEATILAETLCRFASACNDILQVSQDNHTTNKVNLQHLCYYDLRERYNLNANLVIRAIARVAAASKEKRKLSKPRKFNPTSMNLDARTFAFVEKREEITVSTIGGRLKLKLDIGNFQRGLLINQKPTSAVLFYHKQKKAFYINMVINRDVPFPPNNGRVVGIDRGIYNLATTSTDLKFSGRQAMHMRKHYSKLRQSLQKKGTKGAKCLLKRLSGKEQRVMRDINHKISKAIVQSCKPGDTLVMEDLKYIRDRIRVARKQRQIQHSWAFGELGDFIEYKTTERGINVVYVDPHYTSQRCPVCGHVSRNNRHKHLFKCVSCGHTANADLNACRNIRQVHLDTLADGLLSTSPEADDLICKPLASSVGS